MKNFLFFLIFSLSVGLQAQPYCEEYPLKFPHYVIKVPFPNIDIADTTERYYLIPDSTLWLPFGQRVSNDSALLFIYNDNLLEGHFGKDTVVYNGVENISFTGYIYSKGGSCQIDSRRFYWIDFNKDGKMELLCFGKTGFSDMDWVMIWEYDKKKKKYIEITDPYNKGFLFGHITKIQKNREGLISFQLYTHGCCAEYDTFIRTITFLKTTKVSYTTPQKIKFMSDGVTEEPHTTQKLFNFEITKQPFYLRYTPKLQNSFLSSDDLYFEDCMSCMHPDLKGNQAALYPVGSKGIALAEKTIEGKKWYFVAMYNNVAPLAEPFQKQYRSFHTYGWLPATAVQKN